METSTNEPLKRHPSLKQLSREHHHGLLLCWKIRTGLDKNIAPERIKKYTDYFFRTHLQPHFELEESAVFPLLGNNDPAIVQALGEHSELRELFSKADDLENTLKTISLRLNEHIRFEERVLFKMLQEKVPEEQLAKIIAMHNEKIKEDFWTDAFWE